MILTFTYNVKANTITENINPPYWNYSISGTSINIPIQVNNNNQQLHVFQNQGNGYIIGTLVFYQYDTNTTTSPSTIRLGNDNEWFVCDMGNSIYWNNNNTGYTIISIKCHVTLNNNRGIKYIAIDRFWATGSLIVELPHMLSFTAEADTATAIVNSQQQAAQNEINAINNMSSSMQAALGTHASNIISATNNASNQAHVDSQAIQNKVDALKDYDARPGDGDSSRPDTSSIDSLNNREDALFNTPQQMLDNAQRPTINLQPFISAINWIFTTMTSILNTNTLLFSSVMIILSLGLLKLILCR